MLKQRLWLFVSVSLFFGWLTWLFYLALTVTHPIVLSRPQFLVSTLDIVADISEVQGKPSPHVLVRGVCWPVAVRKSLPGQTIAVTNLAECEGWRGAGTYILALVGQRQAGYQVAEIPPMPGLDVLRPRRPPIYLKTADTERQLASIPKAAPP
jgi:hypothetical protein